MPYDPKTNKYTNTTKALNRERDGDLKSSEGLSDKELIADSWRQYSKGTSAAKGNRVAMSKRRL